MIQEGAQIIDIGCVSTKPGSNLTTEREEINKITDKIQFIRKEFPEVIISIDTFRSKVAELCIKKGANIINDISGGNLDKDMFNIISKYNCPYILMHMQGTPKDMQIKPNYENTIKEIIIFFTEKIKKLKEYGIENIIIDPGFGFGKTLKHNYEILNNLQLLKKLKKPILVGVSRKSMINKLLNIKPEEALNGTSILNTICLEKGAKILRVHDVKEAIECIQIHNFKNQVKQEG
ncbi:MAG: dihydropteroate synthase [Flavobacteriales bacterium]|nr:dihydropteroate synthase [Flavobacteriales bacterium]